LSIEKLLEKKVFGTFQKRSFKHKEFIELRNHLQKNCHDPLTKKTS